MNDCLSIEDIRRWLARHVKKSGGIKNLTQERGTREVPVGALSRAVGIDRMDLQKVRDGTWKIPKKRIKLFSRFIQDYENGLIGFEPSPHDKRKIILVHLQTPKPRPLRLSVSWTGGPKLKIEPRPRVEPRIPHFKDIFAGLSSRIDTNTGQR